MAINPLAAETLRDGTRVQIRPIRKTDTELERRFIEGLSPEARRYRFLYTLRTPGDALLRQLTDIDEQREAALIALMGEAEEPREVGVARFCAVGDGKAEVAITVSDDCRLKGLGTLLMMRLIEVARSRGVKALFSIDPADNVPMRRSRRMCEHIGCGRATA
jgi:GNAT superfamily N-acetyltransferase